MSDFRRKMEEESRKAEELEKRNYDSRRKIVINSLCNRIVGEAEREYKKGKNSLSAYVRYWENNDYEWSSGVDFSDKPIAFELSSDEQETLKQQLYEKGFSNVIIKRGTFTNKHWIPLRDKRLSYKLTHITKHNDYLMRDEEFVIEESQYVHIQISW